MCGDIANKLTLICFTALVNHYYIIIIISNLYFPIYAKVNFLYNIMLKC